jgi:hypothetical protein
MAETLTSISERVDDIPLLLGQLERMGVPARLDEHFPTHGNWVGLSLGWVTVVWLTHLLTVGGAAAPHPAPLHGAAGPPAGPERRSVGGGLGGLECR